MNKLILCLCLIAATSPAFSRIRSSCCCESCGNGCCKARSRMHDMQDMHPDQLTREQRDVYNRLSPTYQKIYLGVLSSHERQYVVLRARKGKDPMTVIDEILDNCKKECDWQYRKNNPPYHPYQAP